MPETGRPDAPSHVTAVGTEPPAARDSLAALLDEIVDKMPMALEAFAGKRLADFRWTARTQSDVGGELEIRLDRVERGKAGSAQIRIVLTCTTKTKVAVAVNVALQFYRQTKDATMNVRADIAGTMRTWEFASLDDTGLVFHTGFPRPRGLAGIENVGLVWYATHSDGSKHGVASGVERQGPVPVEPLVAEFWPKFDAVGKSREWALPRVPGVENTEGIVRIASDEWAASVLGFAVWNLVLRTAAESDEPSPLDDLTKLESRALPPLDLYWPRRAVDLSAHEVQATLQRDGMIIPWHVVEAACAALNSGKHVLFTGPPGCGKSKLAGTLATLASGREPLMATASPAWSAGDLIGRYFPRPSGQGLEFQPGFFLRAIDDGNRWLIIDEFNRANIDECFGELFSVLADDVVELPFQEDVSENALLGIASSAPVRILPARRRSAVQPTATTATVDYAVGPSFRLIGTMNDADRSTLHQLSFALLRRFNIIRVEAPSAPEIAQIVKNTMAKAQNELKLDTFAYRVTRKGKQRTSSHILELDSIYPMLGELFARDPSRRKTKSYSDLVRERVVGLATVQDVIRFVAEGIRGASQGKDANAVQTDHLGDAEKLDEHARATCASFLAMALVLNVFPQLDALSSTARLRAVRHIVDVFQPDGEPAVLMRRIEVQNEGGEEGLRLSLISHSEPAEFDVDGDRFVSIAEYLVEELSQQYRGTEEAAEYRAILVAKLSSANA